MGMRSRWSQVRRTRSWRPAPSRPRTRTQIAGEIELVVVGRAAFVESRPMIQRLLALEVLEGADEVDDAGDAEVLGGAGAGLDGRPG